MKKDQDIWAGIVIILLGLFLLGQMGSLSFMQSVYPRVLASIMVVAGVGVVLRAVLIFKSVKKPYQKLSMRDFLLQAAIPGAFVIIVSFYLRELGFYVGAFIVVSGICLLQDFVAKGKLNTNVKSVSEVHL